MADGLPAKHCSAVGLVLKLERRNQHINTSPHRPWYQHVMPVESSFTSELREVAGTAQWVSPDRLLTIGVYARFFPLTHSASYGLGSFQSEADYEFEYVGSSTVARLSFGDSGLILTVNSIRLDVA
jgi:hypothetical protein